MPKEISGFETELVQNDDSAITAIIPKEISGFEIETVQNDDGTTMPKEEIK